MDGEIYDEQSLLNTFNYLLKPRASQLPGNARNMNFSDLDEIDLDNNFLANLMEAQAEVLGAQTNGPMQHIFAHMNINLPPPPPVPDNHSTHARR